MHSDSRTLDIFIIVCFEQKWDRNDSWFIDNSNDNCFENGLFDGYGASTATTNINIVKYDLFYVIIVASKFGGVFGGFYDIWKGICCAIIAQFGHITGNVFNEN